MRFVLVIGTTRTAAIDGISAAGADPEAMVHTPGADAELVAYGRPVFAPGVPVSPTGTPTPALVTRAVRELVGFDLLVLEAGLSEPTGAPTVTVEDEPGEDLRQPVAVRDAESIMGAGRRFARSLAADEVIVAESIPGGTTTALGVLRALGEPYDVSSSLASNPLGLKREVVDEGLAASGLAAGDAAGEPVEAVRSMGDPVLAAVAGFVVGACEGGTEVTLAGGTQLLAAAALCRHAGVDDPLGLATTPFLAADPAVDLGKASGDLALEVTVTDPAFDLTAHPALDGYRQGEAKEGVGMGGALHLADQRGVAMKTVRERIIELYRQVVDQNGP